MNIIRVSDLVARPWRNGGGITREILEVRHGAVLLWRLSMADVASDGPFSDFSGLMRVLTVIDGGAMELITPNGSLMAAPRQPVQFDGGLAVSSKLCDGPLRDLNLMFDPGHIEGKLGLVEGPLRINLTCTAQQSYALHMLCGKAGVGGDEVLAGGDTLVLEAGAQDTEITLTAGSAALLISIAILPHMAELQH